MPIDQQPREYPIRPSQVILSNNVQLVVGVDIALWSCLEINIAAICASIPALKALFVKIIPKLGSLHTHVRRYGANTGGSLPLHSFDERGNKTHTSGNSSSNEQLGKMEIKVHQSIEMKALPAGDDDSEKNLVQTSWMADCYSSTAKKSLGGDQDLEASGKENRISTKGTRIPVAHKGGQAI